MEPKTGEALVKSFGAPRDGKYYKDMTKIIPRYNRLTINEQGSLRWQTYTNIHLDPNQASPSEYGAEFRNYISMPNYKKVLPIKPCYPGNPITVVDQDVSRFPKIAP
ncbi:unnamed protein product [Calicophoron daubneyi]|uniref:Uncharacterized protein n=1 Tax=Calicophoron daubneyi TaxID=300641 RepID=A0AAV2TDS9_CALDB